MIFKMIEVLDRYLAYEINIACEIYGFTLIEKSYKSLKRNKKQKECDWWLRNATNDIMINWTWYTLFVWESIVNWFKKVRRNITQCKQSERISNQKCWIQMFYTTLCKVIAVRRCPLVECIKHSTHRCIKY